MEQNLNSHEELRWQQQLRDPYTAASLSRLLDRIDTLETTVNRLADLLEQAPGFTAMVGDMVDETVRSASDQGIDVEARLQAGLAMAEKLTAPETMAKFDQLLELADQVPGLAAMAGDMIDETVRSAATQGIDVEARLQAGLVMAEKLTEPETMAKFDQLLELADQAPGLAAMAGDMIDETVRSAATQGIDVEARLQAGLVMAEKLTAPETMAKFDQLLELADQAPGLAAMIGDMFDDTYRSAVANGIDPESLVRKGASAAAKIAALTESDEFVALMDSGVLDPAAVGIIGDAGQALVASRKQPIQPIGLWGMLSALRDPDTQRALGFLISVGKEFGRRL